VDRVLLLSIWILDILRTERIVHTQIFGCKISVNYTIMHEAE
jgi:hypothetical protein